MNTVTTIVLAAAAAQWLVFAALSLRAAKRGGADRNFLVSTAALTVAIFVTFGKAPHSPVAAAGMVSSKEVSCAVITTGMKTADVLDKLGKPDEIRDASKTRGPGAETYVYRDSRCGIHLLDGVVELVE